MIIGFIKTLLKDESILNKKNPVLYATQVQANILARSDVIKNKKKYWKLYDNMNVK